MAGAQIVASATSRLYPLVCVICIAGLCPQALTASGGSGAGATEGLGGWLFLHPALE